PEVRNGSCPLPGRWHKPPSPGVTEREPPVAVKYTASTIRSARDRSSRGCKPTRLRSEPATCALQETWPAALQASHLWTRSRLISEAIRCSFGSAILERTSAAPTCFLQSRRKPIGKSAHHPDRRQRDQKLRDEASRFSIAPIRFAAR